MQNFTHLECLRDGQPILPSLRGESGIAAARRLEQGASPCTATPKNVTSTCIFITKCDTFHTSHQSFALRLLACLPTYPATHACSCVPHKLEPSLICPTLQPSTSHQSFVLVELLLVCCSSLSLVCLQTAPKHATVCNSRCYGHFACPPACPSHPKRQRPTCSWPGHQPPCR